MLGTCFCGIYPAESLQKSAVWLLLFFILYKMTNGTMEMINKDFLQQHYQYECVTLDSLFDKNWYLYKEQGYYYLSIGKAELSFISLKFDFRGIVDGLNLGFYLGKKAK